MDAITYTAVRQNLANTMNKVIDTHEPLIITRQKGGAVVMISLEDFNAMQESIYLLGNPANAEKLRKSISDIEAGQGRAVELADLTGH
ncbi:type II toxin-antitoxin system prevent-host-death family antitoxin [Deltaproteobacteria bacterium OttesenSCG-928-K17]|nr:type II toxin-antitoxin system prevent-host-death family antitoxin [Deltaproteobacteria bacterium OttesenSCG-928-K17]